MSVKDFRKLIYLSINLNLVLFESILGYLQQPLETHNPQDRALYMIHDGNHHPALYMYRVKTRLNYNKQQITLGVLRFLCQ